MSKDELRVRRATRAPSFLKSVNAKTRKVNITQALENRILVLDGAMGTMIQAYQLTEEDFRGERFQNHTLPLKGNNDLLALTQPEILRTIHAKYFEAGADIAETNTFSSTRIAQADYGLEDAVYDLNYQSAKVAREVADEFTQKEPHKPRFCRRFHGSHQSYRFYLS